MNHVGADLTVIAYSNDYINRSSGNKVCWGVDNYILGFPVSTTMLPYQRDTVSFIFSQWEISCKRSSRKNGAYRNNFSDFFDFQQKVINRFLSAIIDDKPINDYRANSWFG